MTPELRTERLLLEPYTPADEEDFVALFGDDEVSRWMGEGPLGEEGDRALFHRVFAVYAEERFDVWAVREDGRYLGHAELKRTVDVDGHELVYALARQAWGRGLGSELAQALAAYGFDTLGLDAVHATVAPENGASLALLKKLGFEHIRDLDDGTRVLTRRRD